MDTWTIVGAIGAWGAVVVGGIAIVLQRRGEKRANDRHRRTVQPRLAPAFLREPPPTGSDTFSTFITNSGGAAIDALMLMAAADGLFVARKAVPAQHAPTSMTVSRRVAALETPAPNPYCLVALAKDTDGAWWLGEAIVPDARKALREALSVHFGHEAHDGIDRLLTDIGAETL